MGELRTQNVVADVAAVASTLGGPVYSFAPQPHLDLFAATAGLASGRVVKMCLSYTFLQHPDRPDDPRNFVILRADQREAIAGAENSSSLPSWLRDQIRRMRYPTLFEAVRTSLPVAAERAHPLESRLEAHITDALRALLPHQPRPDHLRGPRTTPLSQWNLHRGNPVVVDGHSLRGISVAVTPALIALGAQLHDRFLTAVIPAKYQSEVQSEFVTLKLLPQRHSDAS